jgi:hypothetical protein
MKTRYRIFKEDDTESEYDDIIQEEGFVSENEEPEAYREGFRKGSELNIQEEKTSEPRPWDPSESFFAYL